MGREQKSLINWNKEIDDSRANIYALIRNESIDTPCKILETELGYISNFLEDISRQDGSLSSSSASLFSTGTDTYETLCKQLNNAKATLYNAYEAAFLLTINDSATHPGYQQATKSQYDQCLSLLYIQLTKIQISLSEKISCLQADIKPKTEEEPEIIEETILVQVASNEVDLLLGCQNLLQELQRQFSEFMSDTSHPSQQSNQIFEKFLIPTKDLWGTIHKIVKIVKIVKINCLPHHIQAGALDLEATLALLYVNLNELHKAAVLSERSSGMTNNNDYFSLQEETEKLFSTLARGDSLRFIDTDAQQERAHSPEDEEKNDEITCQQQPSREERNAPQSS